MVLCDSLEGWAGVGEEGTNIYLWLIHVAIRQKPIQHCKAIILQLKLNFKKVNAMNFKFTEADFFGEREN